jgi:hypothetical protein
MEKFVISVVVLATALAVSSALPDATEYESTVNFYGFED